MDYARQHCYRYIHSQILPHLAETAGDYPKRGLAFLIYFDRDGERYLFVPAGFERREDGNYYCDLQDILAKYGISLKMNKKGECRKLLN